jgi:hypothetical protein
MSGMLIIKIEMISTATGRVRATFQVKVLFLEDFLEKKYVIAMKMKANVLAIS